MLMDPGPVWEEGQPSSGADFGADDPGTSDVLSEISTVVELSGWGDRGEQRAYLWDRVKNDFCDQAVIHWSMSLCRDQWESGNGTYVAGVDTDRRDFRNITPGNPGDI